MENKYHTNVYERIIDMIYLLLESDGISVSSLASKYGLSADIVLEDLKYLCASEELDLVVFPCDDQYDTDDFFDNLTSGKLNDAELYAEQISDHLMITLQLSLFEQIFLNSFLKEFNISKRIGDSNDIFIKNVMKKSFADKLSILEQINEAVDHKRTLLVAYARNSETENLNILPLNVVKMVSDDTYYCMAQTEHSIQYLRLDRITDIKRELPAGSIIEKPEYENQTELFEYRWGMSDDEGPFVFEMIVYNEANLPRRLHRELKHRKYGSWEQISEQSFLYKDIVIDYESLKFWVLGLGSSVRVTSPQRLIDDIVKEAREKLKIYK